MIEITRDRVVELAARAGFGAQQRNTLLAKLMLFATFLRDSLRTSDDPCVWECEDYIDMPDTFRGSCGALWSFIEGGVKENGLHYCPQCGRRVEERPSQGRLA